MFLGPGGPEESWTKSLKRDGTVALNSRGNTKKQSVERKNVQKHYRHLLKERDFVLQIVSANVIPLACALVVGLKLQYYNYFHGNRHEIMQKLNCDFKILYRNISYSLAEKRK